MLKVAIKSKVRRRKGNATTKNKGKVKDDSSFKSYLCIFLYIDLYKKDDLISGSKWHMQKSIGRINSVKGENQCKGTEKYLY